jgi:hypothetical protein
MNISEQHMMQLSMARRRQAETLSNYFTGNFTINFCPEMPAMLIYDGLSSYVDVPLVDKVGEINTVIFKLPPHTSHVL